MRGLWGRVARRVPWPARRWRRWIAWGIVAGVVCLLLAVFLTRTLGIVHLRRDLARLGEATEAATAEQKRLRTELASSSSAQAMEDQAREKLGLIKPGEEKVIFVGE
ncbi:MAG: septum formation initiator family protein [Candidatus Bipolaricaulis sp.]|nr:septum formation initiator family protein [Candidatus Bipolaricaulis sp.]